MEETQGLEGESSITSGEGSSHIIDGPIDSFLCDVLLCAARSICSQIESMIARFFGVGLWKGERCIG